MVQLSTPWGDPLTGESAPVRRFLTNYFDLLFTMLQSYSTSPVDAFFVILAMFSHNITI